MTFNISRFKNRSTEEFDIEIVTPMFLGGADTDDAELRAPSIKGMLRFWWRATCGIDNFQDMKEKEADIFGSTEKKASFSIQIEKSDTILPILKNLPTGSMVPVENKTYRIGIIDYLAYGIRDHRQGYLRKHFPSGSSFKLKFVFYNENEKDNIIYALRAFIDFGGVGAKSRNGFGSLCCPNLENNNYSVENNLANYSSLSNSLVLFNNFPNKNNWNDALSAIGKIYRAARLSLEAKHKYDKRLLVAQPIIQAGQTDERHAKPYFLHVNKLNNGKYKGQILFMPYKYLAGQEGYSTDKLSQYLATCQQMNQKIKELSGGNR